MHSPVFLPSIVVEQTVYRCRSCGSEQLPPDEQEATARLLKRYRQTFPNVPAPEAIKSFRTALGLSQKEAGSIFGGGPNAFSRYERGETKPPRSLGIIIYQYHRDLSLVEAIHQCRITLRSKCPVTKRSSE